jgi:hypothetical protein
MNVPPANNVVDESLMDITISHALSEDPALLHIQPNLDNRIEVENMLAEAAAEDTDADIQLQAYQSVHLSPGHNISVLHVRFLMVDGKPMQKSRILARYSKYQKTVSSTDCL